MGQNRFANKLKKAVVAVAISCVGAFGAPSVAMAYESDPIFNAWVPLWYSTWSQFLSQYNQFVEEVDNQFYAINTYLDEIYTYLISGEGDTGTGVIGAVNANMNKIWKEQRPYFENMTGQTASWDRRNMLDSISGNAIMARAADPRTCSELPVTAGARMAAGGGGGGMRASKGSSEAKAAALQGGSRPNDVAYASEAYLNHKAGGYCAAEDAQYPLDHSDRNAGGSTVADTKKMPDGDARVQSILRPAHDYTDANAVKQYGTSLTYNLGRTSPLPIGDQAKAADDAIATMVSRFSPPSLPKDVESTSAGKVDSRLSFHISWPSA